MRAYDIIIKKRNGLELSAAEIDFIISGYINDRIPDYQVSALLMAIYFQGMTKSETLQLTKSMMNSGDIIDLSAIQGIKVDKHSTGGVGDKTSIVLGPLVAAAGVKVAKMSGRGLGHTGGTIDKLEAFKSFQVELSQEEFIENVNRIGIAIAGQSGNLVPADKKLYALRDVTATVENSSLIAGSIMSKKLASGADAIVLDVKCGDGAFMKNRQEAFDLASIMVEIGTGMQKETIAIITDMEQPLGRAIGNSLEVWESIETLKGNGPDDLYQLCLELGAQMLIVAGIEREETAARQQLKTLIDDGTALAKLKEWVAAQGGDPAQIDDKLGFPQASIVKEWIAPEAGYIHRIKAEPVGLAAMILGAGRAAKEDPIDLAAGVLLHKKVGDRVEKGEPLASFYTNDRSALARTEALLSSAYTLRPEPRAVQPLLLGIVTREGLAEIPAQT